MKSYNENEWEKTPKSGTVSKHIEKSLSTVITNKKIKTVTPLREIINRCNFEII